MYFPVSFAQFSKTLFMEHSRVAASAFLQSFAHLRYWLKKISANLRSFFLFNLYFFCTLLRILLHNIGRILIISYKMPIITGILNGKTSGFNHICNSMSKLHNILPAKSRYNMKQ